MSSSRRLAEKRTSRWAHLVDSDDEPEPSQPVDKGKRRASKPKSPTVLPSPTGENDQDERCAICLSSPIEDKAFADTCLHSFCKTCLFEWAKVKPECPVCRQPFTKLLHDATDDDFQHKETPVPTRNSHSPSSFMMHLLNFDTLPHHARFHTQFGEMINLLSHTRHASAAQSSPGSSVRIGLRIGLNGPNPSVSLNMMDPFYNHHPSSSSSVFLQPSSGSSQFPPAQGSAEHRRYLYQYNIWVQPSSSGRYRDTSPNFLRSNPAVMHRLQPFLNRELIALIDSGENIHDIQVRIMAAVGEYPIRSRRFRRVVEPFILENTDHFIHEFYNFARSTHDMHAYDRNINYVPKQRLAAAEVMTTIPPVTTQIGIRYEDSDDSTSELDAVDLRRRTKGSRNGCDPMRSRKEDPPLIVLSDDEDIPINVVSTTPEAPAASSNSPTETTAAPAQPKAEEVDFNNPRPGPSGVNTRLLFPLAPMPIVRRRHSSSSSDGSLDVGRDVQSAYHQLLQSRYDTNDQSNDSVEVLETPSKPVPELIDISDSDEERKGRKRSCESPLQSPPKTRMRYGPRTYSLPSDYAANDRASPKSSERRPAIRSVVLRRWERSGQSGSSSPLSPDRGLSPLRQLGEGSPKRPKIKSVITKPALLNNMEDYIYKEDSESE